MLLAGFPPRSTPRTFPLAPPEPRSPTAGGFTARKRDVVEAFEREYFADLARQCQGNVSEMARQSSLKRHHVRAYLRKYGIDRHGG